MIEFDATLEDWKIEQISGVLRASGKVYGDKNGRFDDGDHITTSEITENGSGWIKTLNTTYALGQPYKQFKVTILWGENPNQGDVATTYHFDTLIEYNAFMHGVREAGGWLNYSFEDEGFVVPEDDDEYANWERECEL